MARFFVYILASRSRALYVGVTGNLERRLAQHRARAGAAFTTRYRTERLVFAEEAPDAISAIAREKQLKGWRREKKIALIEGLNPEWRDLADAVGSPSCERDPSLRSG